MSNKDDQSPNPFGLPDFSQMLSQMQMPGVDFEQLMQEGQKNIEAVQAANQAVTDGWQSLAQKQTEIFQETMQRWSESMSAAAGATPAETMEEQAATAREGFEQALANMRTLAEITAESQSSAMEIMRKRFEENLQNMFKPANRD